MKSFIKISALFILFIAQASAWDVDLRPYQTRVKDQCNRNTCAYFSCTALLESLFISKFNRYIELSEQYIIHRSKAHHLHRVSEEHGDPYDILLQLKSDSIQFMEKDVPYEKSLFEDGGPCAQFLKEPEKAPAYCFAHLPVEDLSKFKPVRYSGLEVDHMSRLWTSKTQVEIIKDRLQQQRPVVITAKVNPENWDDKTGLAHFDKEIDDKCESGEIFCAGHAILLVGYDDVKKQFLFKNSWGPKWGQEGYGVIGYDYIENFAYEPHSLQFNRFVGELYD
ncbi:papain family cysteine protease [Bacteriovorax sp. BSW11_IV]|uniref:C1 family peptidase n=1 Tax=Bacteriovorax sp. BSW11_IV TaxID=1353529 RepID=UPI000389F6C3|nr:C1 family peptidase [Bacteriovorax sp. BSW11_IV]EQC45824.1 papain family cysteine protease [Bacteriovorax sp. BSW11_IV]